MNDLMAELAEVVRLSEAATEGPWETHPLAPAAVRQPNFECWIPQDKHDAALIAAVNFLRTHHAEIAEAVKQRDVLREMLRKTAAVAVAVLFHSHPDDVIAAFPLDDLQAILTISKPLADANVKVEAIYQEAWDAAIDAQHNSAREG